MTLYALDTHKVTTPANITEPLSASAIIIRGAATDYSR